MSTSNFQAKSKALDREKQQKMISSNAKWETKSD